MLAAYVGHYNSHRPHRALDQPAPSALDSLPAPLHHINRAGLRKTDRLGGTIHECWMVETSARMASGRNGTIHECRMVA